MSVGSDLSSAFPVSLLGLGAMGERMARVLHAAGVQLTVWNRSLERADGFKDSDVAIADSPAGAAAEITLTVLPDLTDVRDVLDGDRGLLRGWKEAHIESPLLVVMGTVSSVAVAELATELAEEGVRVVDAPVSGGVAGAREGRLSVMVGGSSGDFSDVEPVLAHLAGTVRHMGPVGSGQIAKSCNQLVVASTVAALSESMLLARRSGLDVAEMHELLLGGLANSEVLRQKGENWVHENFAPGGTADYQLKDLEFVRELGDSLGLRLPANAAVHDLFRAMVAQGDGALDHSGVYRTLQRISER